MLFFRLFRKVDPNCAYCRHGTRISERDVVCLKHGVVPVEHHCRAFRYDPLKRTPPRPAVLRLGGLGEADFSLEDAVPGQETLFAGMDAAAEQTPDAAGERPTAPEAGFSGLTGESVSPEMDFSLSTADSSGQDMDGSPMAEEAPETAEPPQPEEAPKPEEPAEMTDSADPEAESSLLAPEPAEPEKPIDETAAPSRAGGSVEKTEARETAARNNASDSAAHGAEKAKEDTSKGTPPPEKAPAKVKVRAVKIRR